uniref:Uncharacterized protein n=1 Tax=Aegilops tauschii TaxID=37682 RepID=M8C5P1_AEGTA
MRRTGLGEGKQQHAVRGEVPRRRGTRKQSQTAEVLQERHSGARREGEDERKQNIGLLVAAGDGGWRGVVGAASWTPAPSGGE